MQLFALLSIFVSVVYCKKNNEATCAACTIVGTMLDQYTTFHRKSGEEGIKDFCTFLPTDLIAVCNLAVAGLSPYIDV